jgi:hypothetical protein
MIIQPGLNSPSTLDMVELIRTTGKKFVDVTFSDNCGNPVDIDESIKPTGEPRGELDLEVTTVGGSVLYSESYFPKSQNNRVVHPSAGKYQIKWGDGDNETTFQEGLLFNWHIRQTENSEDYYRTQLVEVVSPKTLSLLPYFRLMLDKSLKVLIPEDWCTLGYSDPQLIVYLKIGLSRINAAQPYTSWSSLDAFPLDRGLDILLRSSLISALDSQYLFAVDTDIPAYADQGHSFVITHGPQIKALRDSLSNELDRDIRAFKMHYVTSGSLGAEFRLGWGFYLTIASTPPGSLVKNIFSNI